MSAFWYEIRRKSTTLSYHGRRNRPKWAFASTAMVFGIMLFRFQIADAAFQKAGTAVLASKTNYLRKLSWIFWISLALAVFSGAMWLVLLAANIGSEPIPVAVSDGTLW